MVLRRPRCIATIIVGLKMIQGAKDLGAIFDLIGTECVGQQGRLLSLHNALYLIRVLQTRYSSFCHTMIRSSKPNLALLFSVHDEMGTAR
jgi:hypothetical protein